MQRYYQRRKEEGLCVKCGKPNDRIDKSCLCDECTEYNRNAVLIDYWHYRNNGICPRCRKQKLYGDEKACPECRAKQRRVCGKWERDNYSKYASKKTAARKKRNDERKSKGLCTYCGKPVDDSRYIKCSRCRAKINEKQRQRRANEEKPLPKTKVWALNGWCKKCGNPNLKEGYKVCESCYDKVWEMSHNKACYEHRDKVKEVEHRRFENSR